MLVLSLVPVSGLNTKIIISTLFSVNCEISAKWQRWIAQTKRSSNVPTKTSSNCLRVSSKSHEVLIKCCLLGFYFQGGV